MTFDQAMEQFRQRRAADYARFAQWGFQHGDMAYCNDMQVIAAKYATDGDATGQQVAEQYYRSLQ